MSARNRLWAGSECNTIFVGRGMRCMGEIMEVVYEWDKGVQAFVGIVEGRGPYTKVKWVKSIGYEYVGL